jgi:hypothetical protein
MHLTNQAKMNLKPVGEWNTSKLVFNNGHVEHWLNGKKVVNSRHGQTIGSRRKRLGNGRMCLNMEWQRKDISVSRLKVIQLLSRNIKIKEITS